MPMIKKFCNDCGRERWHNPSGKKENAATPRCTGCAHPFGTGPKKERHEMAAISAKRGHRG